MRDSKGKSLNIGDTIKQGNHTGIVHHDEFDGFWAQMDNDRKIRLCDFQGKFQIIKKRSEHVRV